jgi:hypothetical protein
MFEMGDYGRIEDFIALAKGGKIVNVQVELGKKLVSQNVPPGVTEDMKDEVGMYLLIADYFFKIEKDMKLVSKVYILGSSEESPDAFKVNKNVANARLSMDYERLKDAQIKFEEKYF